MGVDEVGIMIMFKVAVMAQKGGVSKSTLLVNLAYLAYCDAELEAFEKRACMIDLDQVQQSLTMLHRMRLRVGPDLKAVESFRNLPEVVSATSKEGYKWLFIDTAGQDNPGLSLVVDAVDLCLVPVGHSELDFDGIVPTVQMLRRKGALFRIIQTKVYFAETVESREWRRRLQRLGPVMRSRIAERVAYRKSIGKGLAIAEFDPYGRAGEEMMRAFIEVKEIVRGART
jgi:cellulose biosynthesis protein BcsQ